MNDVLLTRDANNPASMETPPSELAVPSVDRQAISSGCRCRVCREPVHQTFIDLGLSPLANSLVPPERAHLPESFFPLHAKVCGNCFLVQLEVFERAENIFSDYLYFSSYSSSWLEHCKTYATEVRRRFRMAPNAHVVEVASNDGYLLQYFKQTGYSVLGIEPAANIAQAARAKGIPTLVEFFGRASAQRLLDQQYPRADLMVANNVLAHVPDLNDFIAGFKTLLAPSGVATFEFPHLLNLVQKNEFDTVYHEHFSYLSLISVTMAFEQHGLEIFDVEELTTHGGSIRVYVQNAGGPHQQTNRRKLLEEKEIDAGMKDLSFYEGFERRVREIKNTLLSFLIEKKTNGATIVGYGAPAKGNTLLNYCGIRTDYLDYTVDRNVHKQGKYLPGTRIPVYSPAKIFETQPDFILILPWNLKQEIASELQGARAWGARFVTAIPELQIFE